MCQCVDEGREWAAWGDSVPTRDERRRAGPLRSWIFSVFPTSYIQGGGGILLLR